ncbi:GTP 3',8-cyclase MoaA [Lachnoclostridium phytofermentans]|uniref:GTP 3',8-cyclase n=1 Tax=Lachnoclostridium phytofermentans (strain ATCC 700394 / DSM 18823 / ISDg) TaxID=357809 RepID=A9KPV5_LACP7|nr:GTP 3',8-cyclase MoaA [Lachnoclostridium phytofermentans]ABX41854.1 molybdenum cofactor biosynthesis protein A [Lachnoclostridium phytofermentans ISDg]
MIDQYKRSIDYMRISITDRCNLRCTYCMPEDVEKLEHESILTYEEILRICKSASSLGIRKIKITGGEPMVRKDAVKLMANIKAIPGIEFVTLTTNGVLLEEHVEELAKIPLDGVNVSLDTLNTDTFKKITRRDEFLKVWNGIQKLIEAGIPTKINCVPQKGVNEEELMDIAELAVKYPVDVRFIEMMPIGYGKEFEPIKGEEIKSRIEAKYPNVVSQKKRRGFGPAEYITSNEWMGNIGFISAISHKFCSSCNRVRLTSKGFLKSCLCYGDGIDLMEALRSGASDEELTSLLSKAIEKKPLEHNFERHTHGSNSQVQDQDNMEKSEMFKIGG